MVVRKAYKPEELQIKEANLQSVTTHQTDIIQMRDFIDAFLHLEVVETGTSTVGSADLKVQLIDTFTSKVYQTLDLVTGIDLTSSSDTSVTFGLSSPASKLGAGTIGSTLDILRVFPGRCRFQVDVTTANDGTSCTANLYLVGVE